jgi:NADPH:quinone reductase-like Zn-dependent oxidoreductase
MKAYEIGDFPSTGTLSLVERPDPVPGPGEALIRLRATGINARDFAIMRGAFFGNEPKTARIPLSDNAGDVISVGPGVTGVKPGDRVTMCHYWRWLDGPWDVSMAHDDFAFTRDGFLVEKAVVPAVALLPIPECLSYEEASTLQSAGLTAWQAVVESGRPRPGETLVSLGTGGVSVFAVQWAKMLGARVIVTSSSDAKLERMKALGADETINYRATPEWWQAVMDLTGGQGANLVVNTVGMSELDQCFKSCASGARILYIGSNAVSPDRKDPVPAPLARLPLLIIRDLTLKGIVVGSRRMFADLLKAMETHAIRPVIDRVYDFDRANEAIAYAAGGEKLGKVVIRVG